MFLLDCLGFRNLAGQATRDTAMDRKVRERGVCAAERHIHGQNGLVLSVGMYAQPSYRERPRLIFLGKPIQNVC